MFLGKGVPKIRSKFTGEHTWQIFLVLLKISQFHRKTPVLKSLFNKVAGFQALETFRPATLLNRDFNTGDFL